MRKLLLVLIILFIPFISAQNISVDYAEQVQAGEEFTITIGLIDFPEDIYDVKIDIVANGQRVAEILNSGAWKSTFYYVNEIISLGEEKNFSLKIESYVGIADITIKIRDFNENAEIFEGYEIEILQNSENGSENTEQQEEEQNQTEPINETQPEETDGEQETTPPQIIKLNAEAIEEKVIKSDDEKEVLDKSDYAIYGFLIFCILLLLLFLIREKRRQSF